MAWGRRREPEHLPSEAFALEEQHRADGMLAYAADHPEKDTRLWRECAQEAFGNAARATAQPEPSKRKRWGR